jgi:hypothetical protein
LRIDLSTIDGDLAYVNEDLADRTGKGLTFNHGECQSPSERNKGRPV